jgi:putative DNA primase/helicase
MITLAASAKSLEASSSDFDQQPHLLNCLNGTVDLRDGVLQLHDRKNFITKLVDVAYAPMATCPRWEQFLMEVFAGDKELIAFVQRAVGYSLTGHTREHAFFIPYGNGMNGKSVFMRQVLALGGDAARTTSFTTFTADHNKQKGNTPELAELAGMRIVAASEPDEGVRLSESVIKSLTGDDKIEVCKKFEAPFNFVPQFKLWLPTNHKPEIRGIDDGIWRRPRLIPFTVSFEGKADKQLSEKLFAEQQGILAWAVRGAIDWFANGLGECRTVVDATRSYRQESDALGSFIEDCVTHVDGRFTSNAELYRVYTRWCEANGLEPWQQNPFSKKFKARGYHDNKVKGVRGFIGIKAEAPEVES